MKRRVAKRARRPAVRSKAKRQWKAKVARVAKRVTLQNQELKYGVYSNATQLYQEGSNTLSIAAPYIRGITQSIVPGDESTQRIGRDVTLKGCAFRVSFNRPTDTTPNPLGQNLYLRVMVVKLKRGVLNGGTGTANTQFSNASIFYDLSVPLVHSFLRKDGDPNSRIEKVYWDKTYKSEPLSVMAPDDASFAQPLHDRHIKFYVPFHNMKFTYDDAVGADSGSDGDIVMLATAYNIIAAAQTDIVCEFQYNFKLFWKDA